MRAKQPERRALESDVVAAPHASTLGSAYHDSAAAMARCSSRVVAASPIGALFVPLEGRGLHDAQIELVCDEDRAVRVRGEDLNRVVCLALDLCQMSAAAASGGVSVPYKLARLRPSVER